MPPVYPMTLYTPDQLVHFPHMAKRDAEVWLDFLRLHGSEFIAFAYDVALGGTLPNLPTETPESLKGWQYSTALKIDAVGVQGNQVWIIEVRPDATVSALGAAMAYQLVAQREGLFTLPMIPCIVCRNIQPDVGWVCQQIGVQVIIV